MAIRHKDHHGFKTNKLTGLVDAAALERFALSLPKGRENCPTWGHLHRMRRIYRLMAKALHKQELRRARHDNWQNNHF